jgi:ABC-type nitrate/sulfonate/bicarbonate transport system permease component
MNRSFKNRIYPIIFFIAILIIWEIISRSGILPPYVLPAPSSIVVSLVMNFPSLLDDMIITLLEALIGFAIAILLAVAMAIIMDSVIGFKKTVYPVMIISQTIPIIILAPLFIIWFGYGYTPKVVIVILICFFPITISLLQGLASVDKELIDLLRSMGASRFQIYRFVKIPSAMPNFFAGLKIAATYSIMGATIGEWVGGKNGLGVYMIRAKQSFATDRVFAAIIIIVVLSILLLKIIEFAESRYMPWLKIPVDTYIEE